MTQHRELAAGRWSRFSFAEAMANIGSEVERAMKWRAKKNPQYSELALQRALELIQLTLNSTRQLPRLKETARVREALIDYFYGENEYHSTDEAWSRYFTQFTLAARPHVL
ncbi:MAG: hypothetical protein Q8R76_10355 [Candidatus Omnitrophota bacterium]|nr:hypothetical protein [Candidatus Omnitrophota bacterium]